MPGLNSRFRKLSVHRFLLTLASSECSFYVLSVASNADLLAHMAGIKPELSNESVIEVDSAEPTGKPLTTSGEELERASTATSKF